VQVSGAHGGPEAAVADRDTVLVGDGEARGGEQRRTVPGTGQLGGYRFPQRLFVVHVIS
jgi:hypothetical protein